MPIYKEKRVLPYTPQQLFSLVADVEHYPDFLPWILKTQLSEKTSSHFMAEVEIGYKLIKESYHSRVILTPFQRIDIEYIKGPFKYLHNHWIFTPHINESVEVDFFIDFEVKSFLLDFVMKPLFFETVSHMITAFETRALHIYGQK